MRAVLTSVLHTEELPRQTLTNILDSSILILLKT